MRRLKPTKTSRSASQTPEARPAQNINLGGTTAVTTTITDNDSATVSIVATTDGSETGPTDGIFTVTMTTASATDTVIAYNLAGSATSGNDFTALTGQVTILAGDTTATITVATIDDGLVEGIETLNITLTGIASGDPASASAERLRQPSI